MATITNLIWSVIILISMNIQCEDDGNGHDLLKHPFINFCKNFTCQYRQKCAVGLKTLKNPNFFEQCHCICSNKIACKSENFASHKCYCDPNLYGDVCTSLTNGNQSECNFSKWDSYCQPHCSKSHIEQLLCNNIKENPWDSCAYQDECIKKYNDGICDTKCNNKQCMFDGDDCRPSSMCISCDINNHKYQNSDCKQFCYAIDQYIKKNNQSNTDSHQISSVDTYLEIELQATYGLIKINLESIRLILSLKFLVAIDIAIGTSGNPIMYSKYSDEFSKITTTVVFSINNQQCISSYCVTNPHIMALNLLASSYLKKENLPFKIVNAVGHTKTKNLELFNFKNPYFVIFFVVFTFIMSTLVIGAMYYANYNKRWNTMLTPSFSSGSPYSIDTNNQQNNTTSFMNNSNSKSCISFNNNIQSNSLDSNHTINSNPNVIFPTKRPFVVHTSPSDDMNENISSPSRVRNFNFSQNLNYTYDQYMKSNITSNLTPPFSTKSPDVNTVSPNYNLCTFDFGNWHSTVNYSEKSLDVNPYSFIITGNDGIIKHIVCHMDYHLFSGISSRFVATSCTNSDNLIVKNDENSVSNKLLDTIDLTRFDGCDVRMDTIVHDIIKNGLYIDIENLLRNDILFMEIKNTQSFHPLLLSVIYSRYDWLEFFCNNGASLDSYDKNGWRAIHWAAALNDIKALKILHQYRVNIETLTNVGETPLMIACRESSLEVVAFLLDLNVSFLQKNYMHKNCVDIAVRSGRLAVLSIIYRHIKKKLIDKDSHILFQVKQKIEIYFSKNTLYLNKVMNRISCMSNNDSTSNHSNINTSCNIYGQKKSSPAINNFIQPNQINSSDQFTKINQNNFLTDFQYKYQPFNFFQPVQTDTIHEKLTSNCHTNNQPNYTIQTCTGPIHPNIYNQNYIESNYNQNTSSSLYNQPQSNFTSAANFNSILNNSSDVGINDYMPYLTFLTNENHTDQPLINFKSEKFNLNENIPNSILSHTPHTMYISNNGVSMEPSRILSSQSVASFLTAIQNQVDGFISKPPLFNKNRNLYYSQDLNIDYPTTQQTFNSNSFCELNRMDNSTIIYSPYRKDSNTIN